MTPSTLSHLQRPLSDIDSNSSPQLHEMVVGLLHCANLDPAYFQSYTLFNFLAVLKRDHLKSLTKLHVGPHGMLTTPITKFADDEFREFCRELVGKAHEHLENYLDKTPLTMIKQCVPVHKRPKKRVPRRR